MPLYNKARSEVVVASSAVAATHTGTTSETQVGPTVTIPGGALGPNGYLVVEMLWSAINVSGANKTFRVKINGTSIAQVVATTQQSYRDSRTVQNRNSASSQIRVATGIGGGGWGGANAVNDTSTFDTTADMSVTFHVVLANSAETAGYDGYIVRTFYKE